MRAEFSTNQTFRAALQAEAAEAKGSLSTMVPATQARLGGIKVGENLKISADGTLSVDTAAAVEQDNTKPVTAAAVYTEIGNISALLETI